MVFCLKRKPEIFFKKYFIENLQVMKICFVIHLLFKKAIYTFEYVE